MKSTIRSRRNKYLKMLIVGAALLAQLGACPIDGNAVLVEAVRAVLTTASDSLVTSLGNYLSDDAATTGGGGGGGS